MTYLFAGDLARILAASGNAIRSRLDSGLIPGHRNPITGRWQVSPAELRRWLEEQPGQYSAEAIARLDRIVGE